MSWTWLGLAVLVLLAFSVVDGYRKGFIKEAVSVLLVLISVVLVWLINPYVNQFLRENTSVYEKIQTSSETFVDSLAAGNGVLDEETQNELISNMGLPELLQKGMSENNTASVYQYLAVNTFAGYISGYLANVAVNCLSFLVYIVININSCAGICTGHSGKTSGHMWDKQTGWSGNWRRKVYYLRMGRNAGADSFV